MNEIANKTVIVSGGKEAWSDGLNFINDLDDFDVIGIIDPGENDSTFKTFNIR